MINDEERRARIEAEIHGDAPLPKRLAPKYGYCPDCWAAIHNRGAHAEICPGPPPRPLRRLCATRMWRQGNTFLACQRPAGHEGGHIFG